MLTSSCATYNQLMKNLNHILNHFAFAVEKLDEIRDLDAIRNGQVKHLQPTRTLCIWACWCECWTSCASLVWQTRTLVCQPLQSVKLFEEAFKLPALPATTIDFIPSNKRSSCEAFTAYRKSELSQKKRRVRRLLAETITMNGSNGKKISTLISLVHGEFGVMTWWKYFRSNLSGYLFSKNG